MKAKYALALMDMTERFGQTSSAQRLKVGAMIYKNNSIISLGVNGQPPGWETEVCEEKVHANGAGAWIDIDEFEQRFPLEDENGRYGLRTQGTVRHAEAAALEKLYLSTETSDGAEMFISHAPCLNCSLKIVAAKIQKVYYRSDYRCSDGIEYLKKNGVTVEKI
jgi:dCMP deaminase